MRYGRSLQNLREIVFALKVIIGVLTQDYNENTGRNEWVLKSKDGTRNLEWFGPAKPSDERVRKAEQRIQYFKNT